MFYMYSVCFYIKSYFRSFVKEENIVCLPPKKNKSGNYFDWDEDEFDRMKEGCMSATYRGVVNFEDQVFS